MKVSNAAVLAFATWWSCACAEGYGAPEVGNRNNAVLAPAAGVMGEAPVGGSAAAMSAGGTGGVAAAAPVGVPCTQGDVATCPCEGTDVLGERVCQYDMASPNLTQGILSECMGCPMPTPPGPDPATLCSDGMQSGAETGSDCGGPDCTPCPLGSACSLDSDCAEGMCITGSCTAPPSGGTGGSGGSSGGSGEGGSGGDEEPAPEEPVEDCDGVPEGTECDRDCILPSNTARCNSRGDCSCLG